MGAEHAGRDVRELDVTLVLFAAVAARSIELVAVDDREVLDHHLARAVVREHLVGRALHTTAVDGHHLRVRAALEGGGVVAHRFLTRRSATAGTSQWMPSAGGSPMITFFNAAVLDDEDRVPPSSPPLLLPVKRHPAVGGWCGPLRFGTFDRRSTWARSCKGCCPTACRSPPLPPAALAPAPPPVELGAAAGTGSSVAARRDLLAEPPDPAAAVVPPLLGAPPAPVPLVAPVPTGAVPPMPPAPVVCAPVPPLAPAPVAPAPVVVFVPGSASEPHATASANNGSKEQRTNLIMDLPPREFGALRHWRSNSVALMWIAARLDHREFGIRVSDGKLPSVRVETGSSRARSRSRPFDQLAQKTRSFGKRPRSTSLPSRLHSRRRK